MESIGKNSLHQFEETDEKPTETERQLLIENYMAGLKSDQTIKIEEPLIEIKEEPVGSDPLLVDETSGNLVVKRFESLRTYKKRGPKPKYPMKKLPQLPLKDLVVQAMETMDRRHGHMPDDIKRFLNSTYGIDFKRAEVTKALQMGVESGAIMRVKKASGKKRKGRYILPKFNGPQAKPVVKNTNPTIFNAQQSNIVTAVKNNHVLRLNDGLKNRNVDLKRSVAQEEVKIEVDTSLPNGQLDNDSRFEPTAEETYCSVRRDEIDFMVLHSMYTAPHSKGILLYEIAEFIDNYYDIEMQSSLPCIGKYIDYGIENGFLVKNGDRYDTRWKMNWKPCLSKKVKYDAVSSPIDESVAVGDKLENVLFCTTGKLEPEEIGDLSDSELASNDEKMEMNTNNNVICPIDEEEEAAYATEQKYNAKRKHYSFRNSEFSSKRARNELPQSVFEERIIRLNDNGAAFAPSIKAEEPYIKLEMGETTEDRLALLIRRKVLSFPFDGIRTRLRQSSRGKAKSKGRGKRRKFNGEFDEPTYTLAEMKNYISEYPKILLEDPVMLSWDLSWEDKALTNNVPCLKLTGFSVWNDENIDCKICGSEFKFGPLNCDVCSFEQENLVEKCNICDLLSNRSDVFHKHFLWEHRPMIERVDDPPVPILEENIGKVLSKLIDDDLLRCGICRRVTNDIGVFQNHFFRKHTSKINMLPRLPEEGDFDEVVIFRNEITNVCCLRCNECGFVSNRRDFMLYHILDTHELEVESEKAHDNRALNANIEPQTRDESGKKVKWSFGLCHVCGNSYNHILNHLRRHPGARTTAQSDDNKKISAQHEALLDAIESLPLCERVFRKPARPKRKRKKNANRSYLCHLCGKVLKHSLSEHLRIHNPRMWGCSVCGRQFNRQSNLLTHKRVHTREKPFECDICKMTFGYKCSIKGHIVNVHSETVR